MTDHAAAIRTLRAHRQGVLVAGGVASPLRFVTDNATGRVVFPTNPNIFEDEEAVLFTPEESIEALQLLLLPRPTDPDTDEACDRWKAYHGTPEYPRWASCGIESGRLGGDVVDGEALMVPNPLRAAEPALCKRLNTDRARLTRLCRRATGVEIPAPLAVGVDPDGLDVKARFGIVRVPFAAPAPAPTGEAAGAAIDALLAEAAP